jgi:uncharacterized Zn finger protein
MTTLKVKDKRVKAIIEGKGKQMVTKCSNCGEVLAKDLDESDRRFLRYHVNNLFVPETHKCKGE